MMRRQKHGAFLVTLCTAMLAFARPSSAAVTEDSFQLRNTGDLVELCSTVQSDPLYTPARNFCEGFAVGVFRVLQEQDLAKRSGRMFCLPQPSPTRDEAIASFVQWVKMDARRTEQSAADGIASYLAQQFPCRGKR